MQSKAKGGWMRSKRNSAEVRALKFSLATALQVGAFEKRESSSVEKAYGTAMQRAAAVLLEYAKDASLEELLDAEQTLQKNDLAVYAQRPGTMASVQEGINDLEAGMAAHALLLENTDAYRSHPYRQKERLPPERVIPLDAMRRALRGQIKRVENYRSNVMGNIREQEFLSARMELLHRAEKLYDALQRERLS